MTPEQIKEMADFELRVTVPDPMTQNDEAERLIGELRADAEMHEDLLPDRAADMIRTQAARIAELEGELADGSFYKESDIDAMMARAEAAEAEVARLREDLAEAMRRLGGGCDANGGGDHTVITQGKYKFCGGCGETLTGIRYCHTPRAALQPKQEDV